MKNEIEYKILNFLKDNDNGEFIDIPSEYGDIKILKDKISDLKKRDFILIKPYAGTYAINDIRINGINKPPKCKIILSGKEYLYSIDKYKKENKTINYNLSNIENNQIIHESELLQSPTYIKAKPAPNKKDGNWFRKFTKNNPFIVGIILIILAIILGFIFNN